MNKDFDIEKIQKHFAEVLRKAPAMLGNDAVNFFLDRFQQQNWLDTYPEAWQKRKVNNRRNSGRALLVLSGRLRRSIRITSLSSDAVTIGSDVPYARVHNEGFSGTVNIKEHSRNQYKKAKVATDKLTKSGKQRMKTVRTISGTGSVKEHTKKMRIPRRKFMGESAVLKQQMIRHLTAELMKGLS